MADETAGARAWEPPPPCNERCDHRLGDHHDKACSLYFGRRDASYLCGDCGHTDRGVLTKLLARMTAHWRAHRE